ncbi:MAG: SDR family NAD(P)-dependent oxidoreductase [Thermodesulfobacteriota bacterium]
MELSGKVALVLGAVKGIGRHVGLTLAREGVRLGLTCYDWEESLPEMKEAFAQSGAGHLIHRVDLTDRAAVEDLVRAVADRFGGIDMLINNIERGGWPVVHGSYTPKQWDLEMATTLRAKQWVFEAALPLLKASPEAAVVNFSSIAGMVGRSGPAGPVFNDGYAAASRGVSLLTETWARMGAPHVRVNEIMLGFVETRHGPQTRGWGLLTSGQRQAILDHTLAGRLGTLDDVARAVLFVLRDAPFMTGAVLRLDGGYVLGGEKVAPLPDGVERNE